MSVIGEKECRHLPLAVSSTSFSPSSGTLSPPPSRSPLYPSAHSSPAHSSSPSSPLFLEEQCGLIVNPKNVVVCCFVFCFFVFLFFCFFVFLFFCFFVFLFFVFFCFWFYCKMLFVLGGI